MTSKPTPGTCSSCGLPIADAPPAHKIEGWAKNETDTNAKKKVDHFIRKGRRACNGMRWHGNPITDTRINRPGGCIACKIALGLCSPWHKGYADPRRRGAA